jgi:hypothetical protein
LPWYLVLVTTSRTMQQRHQHHRLCWCPFPYHQHHEYHQPDRHRHISCCSVREEFRQGCEYLNQLLSAEDKLTDVDHLLDLIDFDHSNSIELNEFFEVRPSLVR